MSKTVNMLNNKIETLIEKFAVKGKVKLVGSNQRRGMLFTSDYDIMTNLKGRAEILAEHFQKVMKEIPKKEYYFMDFKCGLFKKLIYDFDEDDLTTYLKNPLISESYKKKILESKGEERVKLIRDLFILRWTRDDIINGYVKLIDGSKYSFVDSLKDDTIIKLDIIIPVGDRFAEVSEMYMYKQTTDDSKSIIQSLSDDIEKYRHNNSMKSLKRLYSIISLESPNNKRLSKLEEFFNSEYGLLNKVANDLDVLLLLTEKHNIPFDKIVSNLQMLKENISLSSVASKKKILMLNKVTPKNYREITNKMILYLRSVINPAAKKLLQSLE
jgi:hypothetical protein|nr:MAG: hypothetical protein [Lake Baikal virophage 15]